MKNLSPANTETHTVEQNVQVTVLPNGVTVATSKRDVQTVITTVGVMAGGRFENENEAGISHFLEHMAFKGTPTRDALTITQEAEILGADVNASTGKNSTKYIISGLPEHIATSLDILADVIQNSTFPKDEIEREQEVVCEEIAQTHDDLQDWTTEALFETAYANQPMGRSILGTPENVRSFTKENLQDYVNRFYHAASIVVTAVGCVDHESFVRDVEARFGQMAVSERPTASRAVYTGGETRVIETTYDQAHIILAFDAPGRWEAAYAPYNFLADLIGTGMSAPLFQEIREKRGMCYSVGSAMFESDDNSLFLIHGSTGPEKVEKMMQLACAELAKVAAGEINETDWTRARNQFRRQLAQFSDSLMMKSSSMISQLLGQGRVQSTEEVRAVYDNVTKEQVIAAAKALLTSEPTVVVAGNAPDVPYMPIVKAALAY